MIYLDHAATSLPKPAAVPAAMQRWFDEVGVSAERGDGPRSKSCRDEVARVRRRLADHTGVDGDHIAFCSGATEGLNLALRALLQPRQRVVTTTLEHASVARPLAALRDPLQLDLDVVACASPDADSIAALRQAVDRAEPGSLLVATHASNVTGEVLALAELLAHARQRGVHSLVDACQTAGYLPLDLGADVLVASGHKAMHGPPGIGFIAARADLTLLPQKQGGTGSSRALDQHPTEWPQAFEAGTPNTPAIYGLGAALDWLDEHAEGELLARANQRLDAIDAALRALSEVRVFRATGPVRTPVLSFVHQHYDPLELGSLFAAAGVHLRSGFHCAPWLHAELATEASGTVRVSTAASTTEADVRGFCDALRTL